MDGYVQSGGGKKKGKNKGAANRRTLNFEEELEKGRKSAERVRADANSTFWCPQCNEFGDFEKTKEYSNFAPITIFSIERFKGSQKLQDSVIYPEKDLKLLDGTYDLYAVINHQGSAAKNGGHYSAYCLHENGQWYDFADQKVTPISDPQSANAYILFYKK